MPVCGPVMCEEVGCDVATAKMHRDGDLGTGSGESLLPHSCAQDLSSSHRPCCRGRRLALTLAHSVSLSGGQLMGERTSTAPRGVLLQWWRAQSAIQDAPGCRAQRWAMGTCGQMGSLGEPIGHSSKNRCSPKTSTARDPVYPQPWVLVLGGHLRGCIPRTGRWCHWGK